MYTFPLDATHTTTLAAKTAELAECQQECVDREAQHKSTSEIAGKAIHRADNLYRLLREAVKELEFAKLMDTPLGEDLRQAIADSEEK